MSKKNCCIPDNVDSSITVRVDVTRIVKYVCISGIIIVGIIFCNKSFRSMLEKGYFDQNQEN